MSKDTMDLELKNLEYYTGTERYWRYYRILLTDGVKYIMDNGYAWFVTDAIVAIQSHSKIREHLKRDPFLSVKLKVDRENCKAKMVIDDGNGNVLYEQSYEFTDAKRDLTLYYADGVLMLNTEY